MSADKPARLAQSKEAEGLRYTLLSDARMQASRAFGLAWQVSDAEVARLESFGIDLEEASGETHHQLPVPAVFLVDRERRVRFRYFDPDYRVRLDPERVVEAARRTLAPGPSE